MEVRKFEMFVKEVEAFDSYGKTITCACDAYGFAKERLMLDMRDRERVVMVVLDNAGGIIGYEDESIGDLNSAAFHPRELMKFAILSNAAGAILLHNHPSGNTNPSTQDIVATERLKKAFDIMGIRLLDHIIVGREEYTSMNEQGCVQF